MTRFAELLRARLVPAALTAAGVALVTAGLLTYTDAGVGGPVPSPSATAVAAAPTPTAPPRSPAASSRPTPSSGASGDPVPSASPSVEPRVATRVAVPALQIDLPVILPPGGPDAYPVCDVAMYIRELGQPGGDRAIYLYAHAREGMFLPLLEESEMGNGERMIGMLVQVWTSDEQLFLYEITEVRPHQTDLDDALNADDEQLWLQTSEGPAGTVPKLQVVAEPLGSGPADDPADAHPTARPVECS